MPDRAYIKLNAICKRLKSAEKEQMPIYVHAPSGAGKTMAVRNYYRGKEIFWMSGIDGYLSNQPELSQIRENVIVIDDISWITDLPSQKYIRQLLDQNQKMLVLIGRSRLPRWLSAEYLSGMFLTADESNFTLEESHITQLASMMGVRIDGKSLTDSVTTQILSDSLGNVMMVKSILLEILNTGRYDKGVFQTSLLAVHHYFDRSFYELWTSDMRNLLLHMADCSSFDQEMAMAFSLESNVASILETALQVGDFLEMDSNGRYQIRPYLRRYLLWKRSISWTPAEFQEYHKRAVVYYRMKGQIQDALRQCSMTDDKEQMVELLIQNARLHPGVSHLYESREYYLALPEDVVLKSPVLISGMSMLYSLMLQPEVSEKWYNQLSDYIQNPQISRSEKKEALSMLIYLDLCLPHRSSENILKVLKKASILVHEKAISLPGLPVTGNLPSLMDGGKDFCEWSKQDKALAKILNTPVELVLGEYGIGLVNIALAESLFEKGTEDSYDIISLLQSGISKAEHGGRIEICFAGIGILTKLHVSHKQMGMARSLLNGIEQRAREEHAFRLLPNIEAMKTRLSLLKGDIAAITSWMNTEPNENLEFYIMDRYRYMVKLRCYIALDQYAAAWNLSEKLDFYFSMYHRTYLWIENMLLRAIISFRYGTKQWQDLLQAALERAQEYHFVWVIAREGAAVKPLLDAMDFPQETEFIQTVKKEVEKMTLFYPNYLGKIHSPEESLTDMEKRILHLHCEGMTTGEIMQHCSITERTLKFHNSNIYKKLGVKNKQEAIYTARKRKLTEGEV